MITVTCINQSGETYQRGIVAASINTVTEHDTSTEEVPRSWVKFWDGEKATSVVVSHSIADLVKAKFVATHGKKAPVAL